MKNREKQLPLAFFPPGQHPFLGSSSIRYDDMTMQLAYMLPQHPHSSFSFPQTVLPHAQIDSSSSALFSQHIVDDSDNAAPPTVENQTSGSPEEAESSKSSTKNSTKAEAVPPDPNAPAFLREVLGEVKYASFSAKLFERRLGGSKVRNGRKRKGEGDEDSCDTEPLPKKSRGSHGATIIEFLVKTEVVKEVLRTYVPHPYNPLKSLAHPYSKSPTGFVVLTRPTVLHHCGWSNTQFSYWARRSEAIACLSQYDDRLSKVRAALEGRLAAGHWGVHLTNEEADAVNVASLTNANTTSVAEDIVTGKAIDAIVEQVKKRTGASQFIRGKHSSLDPFGKVLGDDFAHGLGRTSPDPTRVPSSHSRSNSNVPDLAGTGGGGGIRITDVRKRASEARKRGETIPAELIQAEEEAHKVAAAKAMGKGKRGPGKSKGIAGGDNHGRGSAQEQLHAAAIIDMMQQGVLSGAGVSQSPQQQDDLTDGIQERTARDEGHQPGAVIVAGPSRYQTQFPSPSNFMPSTSHLPAHEQHTTPHFNGQPYTGLPNLYHHGPLHALAHQAEVHAHLMKASRELATSSLSSVINGAASSTTVESSSLGAMDTDDPFDPVPYAALGLSSMALIGIPDPHASQRSIEDAMAHSITGGTSSFLPSVPTLGQGCARIRPSQTHRPSMSWTSKDLTDLAPDRNKHPSQGLNGTAPTSILSNELDSPMTAASENYFLRSGPFSRLEESSERGASNVESSNGKRKVEDEENESSKRTKKSDNSRSSRNPRLK